VIQNTITNPSIHYLIVAGKEPEGHRSGATLLSLCKSGIDRALRVIGSPGRRPVLKNVTPEEVEAFRSQVNLVDMIGCEDAAEVVTRIGALSRSVHLSCSGKEFARVVKPVKISAVEVIQAEKVKKTELDKGGYFVILPLKEKGSISVEHYANDNRLLRIIEGKDAVSLYRTIVANGWVTQLSHAAYLGKELDRAELSMKLDFKYVQDGADSQ
jgi:tetrahydromethanopterin S-methyltransferase subunit A